MFGRWTDEEGLAVVTEDANVHIYNVYEGVFEKQFTMGQIAAQSGIREAKFCPNGHGLVVLTNGDGFFSVGNFNDPKPKRFAAFEDPVQATPQGQDAVSMPNGSVVSSWAIHMNERSIEVIVSAYRNIFVLDPNESFNPVLDASQLGVYSAMSVSPSGRLIALFGETGKIWVLTTDFQDNITAFDTQSRVAPRQLVWCGSDSVVAYWDQLGTGTGTLLMVGPRSKYINYSYERRVHLMPEVDGLRIIGETHHEFLQAVPDSVEKIFQLGFSKYPGAMLYMARQAFEQKDPMADDLIRKVLVVPVVFVVWSSVGPSFCALVSVVLGNWDWYVGDELGSQDLFAVDSVCKGSFEQRASLNRFLWERMALVCSASVVYV